MSFWTTLKTTFQNGVADVEGWFKPEIAAGEDLLSELGDEIERLGPQLVYDTVAAALATVTSGTTATLTTGQLIEQVAAEAIGVLKSKGLQDLTAAVYGAVSGAVLKLNSAAAAQGVTAS